MILDHLSDHVSHIDPLYPKMKMKLLKEDNGIQKQITYLLASDTLLGLEIFVDFHI